MCQFVCIHTCMRIYSIAEYRIFVYTCVFCREKARDMLPIHYCIHMCKFVCMDTYTYIFYCRISYIHVYTSIYSAYRERETCYPSACRERERDATRLHIYIYREREREMLPVHHRIPMCKFVCIHTYTYIFYCRISCTYVYTYIYSA